MQRVRRRFSRREPDPREARIAWLVEEQRWDEARVALAELVLALPGKHPRRAVVLALLAHVCGKLEQWDRARAYAEQALRMKPLSREAQLLLAHSDPF
jgi:predicted Zn-dependent protease